MSEPAVRLGPHEPDDDGPPSRLEFTILDGQVQRLDGVVNGQGRGLLDRVTKIEHNETARAAVQGFILYVAGIISALAAIAALKWGGS